MSDTLARLLVVIGGSAEISILAKATVIMLAGLGATQLAARSRASVRHVLLASTFVALLLLPAALLLVPAASIPVAVHRPPSAVVVHTSGRTPLPSTAIAGDTASQPRSGGDTVPASKLSVVVLFGWAAGFALLAAALGVSLWRLSCMRRFAYPWPDRQALVEFVAGELGLRKRVALALHEDLGAPITCGTRRPAVILPSDATTWSDADVRRALIHEMEHIRRNDWAMQLVARGTCALYWFHPLVWKLRREFCLEAERACDDAVLRGENHADYADQLVQLARRMSSVSTVATLTMAGRSDLSTRVSAILDGAQKRGPVGMFPVVTTAAAALVATLTLAPLRAVEILPQPQTIARAEQAQPASQAVRAPRVRILDRALFEAAHGGDIAEMTALLNAGANANAAIPGDGSPLIGAASRGYAAALRLLLDQGADPNLAVRGDGTALIVASRAGRADVVALLLERGADLEQVVPGDENALIQASGSGRLDVARLLVSRGANVNARVWADGGSRISGGEWRSPLSMAKRGGHHAVVEYLISTGAIE
jgi:beta-lactamase regulating signal transducer with metallopeptidase domain